MATSSRSNHELLQIINGKSALRSQEEICNALKLNQKRLLEMLDYYKKPSNDSANRLKNDNTIGKASKEFILKLSTFLGLDEWQSHQLLLSYLMFAFKGTRKQLQVIIGEERNSQALIIKIMEYYFSERMCLLHCIKHILSFWQDENHPYLNISHLSPAFLAFLNHILVIISQLFFKLSTNVQYSESINDLMQDDQLNKNLISQLEKSFISMVPTSQKHGQLMNEKQSYRFAVHCLREQCELLEIVLLFYRYFELLPDKLLEFLRLFQRQGFGTLQPNRHLYNGDKVTVELMNRVGFLCSMIAVEGMDLLVFQSKPDPDSMADNLLVKDEQNFKEIERTILSWNNMTRHHGPVVLSWAVLHSLVFSGNDSNHTVRKLGQQSLQLQTFQYMTTMLDVSPFNGQSITAMTCHTQVYALLSLVLTVFHEDTLGDVKHVLSVACKVVKKKHISEQFWELGQDTGVYILLQSLCSRFPLEFSPFIRLCISLSECGAEKIFHYLDGLSSYIELLDNNRADSIDTISDGQWQLQRDKFIYRPDSNTSGLVIPKGTLGTLYDENPGLPYIVWDWEYSAWQLILCKIDDLLRIARHNIELSPLSLVNDVKYAIDLVGHMVQSDFSLATRLQPIITRIYPLVQRFNTGNGVTLDMISSCVKCLVTLAQHEPHKVWKDLQQTGFLPYTGRVYSDVAMAASGAGIFPGNYGNLLGNQERQVGQYPVTKEFLCLLSTLIKGLFSKQSVEISQDVLACVIFVQWEIFASFHKWRYMDITEREEIGKRSLEIFHNVLHVSPVVFGDSEVIGKRSSVAVRDAVVHGLLHTNAGETLLHILATGVDAIELRLIEYGSFLNNPAQDLTQLIKLAFSVVNRLLILKPNQDIMSPLEQELTEQHRTVLQDTPLIATIASYIYHRHDPRLPTLSTLLLKRLAMVAPMSIYGSLGIQVEALKDAYQSRLEALTEDTRLKVVILEFLTVAVETQPGLIELFLDLEVKDLSRLNATEVKSTTEKEINLGKWSILQIVLDMIESNKQGTTHCPPELHAACLSFLYSLWQDRRDTAMSVLRKRPQFWENVTTPLFKDLTLSTDIGTKGISAEVKTVAYAMKIISSESYYIASGSLDKDFKAQLQKLQQDNRYVYWSQFVKELVDVTQKDKSLEDFMLYDHETLSLLSAWKVFTLVAANTSGCIMCLNDDPTKEVILDNIISALKTQVANDTMSLFNLKSGSLLSSLYLSLLKHWSSCHYQQWHKLIDLVWTLEKMVFGRNQVINRIQSTLLAAISVLLQYNRDVKITQQISNSLVGRLFPLVCLAIQQSSTLYCQQPTDITDRLEDQKKISSHNKKHTLPIIGVCLLDELVSGPVDTWLPLLRQHSILPLLITTLQSCIVKKQGLYYVEAVMNLLLNLSQIQQAAEAVSNCGLTQHTCITFTATYQKNTEGEINGHVTIKEQSEPVTWLSVYRQSLTLMASMLATLKHSFLTDALNFFGVHQDRITQCLSVVKNNHTSACMLEAERTTVFLFQLAHFPREWRFEMPDGLSATHSIVCHLIQNCMALLLRPRLLQHRLLHSAGSHVPQSLLRPIGSVRTLQHQTSTDDIDTPSQQLMVVQARLLGILGNSLGVLRHFSPDLLEILLNQSMDVSQYTILFNLAFSTPAIDQDNTPSFGSLVSCINMCVRILYKLDGSRIGLSPSKSPEKSPARNSLEESPIHRAKVLYVLENCLFVTMSQGMRYLKEPSIVPRDKQLLKRELGTELSTFLISLQRYFRRGGPGSPSASPSGTMSSLSSSASKTSLHGAFIDAQEQAFFRVVNLYVQQVLR